MSLSFRFCFALYFLKLSAGSGFEWYSKRFFFSLLYLNFQTYGTDLFYRAITPLDGVGLLRAPTARTFPVIRKSFHLCVQDVQEQVLIY